ncbi:hypothetical protein L6452_39296 [Arctium lappa]|uniref:Uncharacterized protein n=1 Tax=Arctium lappa TaxID=4217 RepID=A0ACB8XRW8_ARCLA|nr:hypothetical protein L6452_39296 [Arctium lappa]
MVLATTGANQKYNSTLFNPIHMINNHKETGKNVRTVTTTVILRSPPLVTSPHRTSATTTTTTNFQFLK